MANNSSSQHTPGPWYEDDGCITSEQLPGRNTICSMEAWLPHAELEQEANADLICASPDLLDELRVARAALADFVGLTEPHAHALARRFSATIAKATGSAA